MQPYYQDDAVTIYHGDAFDVIPRLSSVGAVVTDPPYSSGGAFRGDRARATSEKYTHSTTAHYRPEFGGDARDQRSFAVWASMWMMAAKAVSLPSAPICVFTDWRQLPTMSDALQVAGWTWRGVAVWSKKWGRPVRGGFTHAAEYALWGFNGPTHDLDIYLPGHMEHVTPRNREHVAQKPEAVMRWLLGIVPGGATVLDPFMGSGSTMVAARDLGLRSIGVEYDERYCEIAARRLSQGQERLAV